MLESRHTTLRHSLSSAIWDVVLNQLDVIDSLLNHEDEHSTFGGIERQLSAIENFEMTLNQHTRNLKIKLARERNQMLPVHHLPRELFTQILLQTRETSSDFDTRSVIRWTTVCSIWKHVIISTPILWRRLDLADGSILDLALSRNGSVPLQIHWRDLRPPPGGSASPSIASPHTSYQSLAPRCRDLHIYTIVGNDCFTELFKLYGAYATTIDLSARRSFLPMALPAGPNLESLALRFVSFAPASWSSPRLTGLLSLFLQGIDGLPTDAQFYNMLASTPCLSTLVLDAVEDIPGTDHQNVNPVTPLLSLPDLRLLYMDSIPARLARLILTKFQCPNCEFLHICPLYIGKIIPNLPLIQNLRPSSWVSRELIANVWGDSITIHNPDNGVISWPLEYSLTDEYPSNLIIGAYFEDGGTWENAISTLSIWFPYVHHLRVSHHGPDLSTFLRCCRIQWQVCSIHLDGPGPFLVRALHLLGEQRSRMTSEDMSDTSLVLPRLSYLHIDWMGPKEPLEALVEAVVGLIRAYTSVTTVADPEQAPMFQIVGPKMMIEGLRSKNLPLNVVIGQ